MTRVWISGLSTTLVHWKSVAAVMKQRLKRHETFGPAKRMFGPEFDQSSNETSWTSSAPTLNLRVVRSDASQVPEADTAPNEVVFDEQVSMTDGSNPEDTFTTWSGTLKPSEWTGGCQQALYRIEYDFGTEDTHSWSGWFPCSGPDVDPANPFLYSSS